MQESKWLSQPIGKSWPSLALTLIPVAITVVGFVAPSLESDQRVTMLIVAMIIVAVLAAVFFLVNPRSKHLMQQFALLGIREGECARAINSGKVYVKVGEEFRHVRNPRVLQLGTGCFGEDVRQVPSGVIKAIPEGRPVYTPAEMQLIRKTAGFALPRTEEIDNPARP